MQSVKPDRMDTQQAEELFNNSYERVSDWQSSAAVSARSNEFFFRFYEIFTAKSPEVAAAFRNTDMTRQVRMLRQSIVYLVNFYATHNADDFLRRIARRHARSDLDIAPYLYDLWLEALLEAVAEFDPRFSDETAEAWRMVLRPGIEFMKSWYEDT